MKTTICAIIEDEPLGAKTLESMLKTYQPEFRVDAFARTLAEAKKVFNDPDIELVFADVELLDGNIFDVLKEIDFDGTKHIVFTTAYEEFGAKAFNYPALHYLMKPISPAELEKALLRFREATDKDAAVHDKSDGTLEFDLKKMLLPTQNGMIFLDYDMVVRIQSSNKYSIVFTTDKKQLIVSKPLSRFEEVVSKKGFVRIHDSHIINLTHVKSYLKGKGGEIVMSDGSHVPISVRKKDSLSLIFKDMI